MVLAERTRDINRFFRRRTLRSGIESLRPAETIMGINALSAQERADGAQTLFMESYWLNEQTGHYDSLLGTNKHELGNLPERSHRILAEGRGILYVSYHDCEHTSFLWGKNMVRPNNAFLAINYVSPVDKKSQQVERFIIRADDLTKDQAQEIIKQIYGEEKAQARDEGEGIISFRGDFDPLEKKSFFADAIKNVIGEGNLTPKQQRVVGQLDRQCQARMNTHDASKEYFDLGLKFIDGKLVVQDRVLDQWVFLEDTTTDPKLLSFILYNQKLIAKYLANPQAYGKELKIQFGVMLSARTAGFRSVPSAAMSEISVDQSGTISQRTGILPADSVNPLLFDIPQSNITFSPDHNISSGLSYDKIPNYGFAGGLNLPHEEIKISAPPRGLVTDTILVPSDSSTPTINTASFMMMAPAIVGYLNFSQAQILMENSGIESAVMESATSSILTDHIEDEVNALPKTESLTTDTTVVVPEAFSEVFTEGALDPDLPPETPDTPDDFSPPSGGGLVRTTRIEKPLIWVKQEIPPRAKEVRVENLHPISSGFKDQSSDGIFYKPEPTIAGKEFVVFASTVEVSEPVKEQEVKTLLLIAQNKPAPSIISDEVIQEQVEEKIDALPELEKDEINNSSVSVNEKPVSFSLPSESSIPVVENSETNDDFKKPVLVKEITQLFLALRTIQAVSPLAVSGETQTMPDWLKEIFLTREFSQTKPGMPLARLAGSQDGQKSYPERVEENNHQTQKQPKNNLLLKKKINWSLLKLLILVRMRFLQGNLHSVSNLKNLLLTDSLILFLINPNLFLIPKRSVRATLV
ncbi:hypothetical protein HY345_02760 [Candidatus Microgenomates bacterium]|nr:hypothetical protein [Candidatus Microgenomates bacterium]